MARLRFEIESDRTGVSLQTYSIATEKLRQLLREMDGAISGKTGGMVNWYIADLGKNGTLSLEVESRLRKPPKHQKVKLLDTAPAVAQSFVTGFENIEQRGISPPYLSEFGLRKLEGMMELLHKNGATGFVVTSVEEKRSAVVTEKAVKTIRELLPPLREDRGSVEGMLEIISIHGVKKFVVYDSLTHKGITCVLRNDELLSSVTDSLGRKVHVDGLVCFNVKEEPVKVIVEYLRKLGAKQLPTAAQLTGSDPNFTGDLTTEEYIRSIRRG